MNIVKRILIVVGNLVLFPIMLPIQAVRGVIYWFKYRKEYNLLWMLIGFVIGIGISVFTNIKFLISGDLDEFKWIYEEYKELEEEGF